MSAKPADNHTVDFSRTAPPAFLHLAGARFWTASLVPALTGTTLPFWLQPPGFSFRWSGAFEFLIATLLFHAGFLLLQARIEHRSTPVWSESKLLGTAVFFILVACLLGFHLNSILPGNTFLVSGCGTIIAGLRYAIPPFSFHRRAGGEIIVAQSLGLLPVLGAYLVQTGDLTRTVYMAAMPLVVATGIWIWTMQLASREEDLQVGKQTMIDLLGIRFSGRSAVLILALLFYLMLLGTLLTGALSLMVLHALLFVCLVWKIVKVSWNDYSNRERMVTVSRSAARLHLAMGLFIVMSPLARLFD